jgi:hypothetical protein
MPHKELHMVDAIPIIELIGWFADPNNSEIFLSIDIPAHTIEMGVPPHSQLQLVVPVEGTGIEYVGLSSLSIGPDIAIPEVAMQKAWLDISIIRLKWSDQQR